MQDGCTLLKLHTTICFNIFVGFSIMANIYLKRKKQSTEYILRTVISQV